MKVKKLKWIEKGSTEWYKSLIDTSIGVYNITIGSTGIVKADGTHSSKAFYSVSIKNDFQEEFEQLQQAKNFCQEHFNKLILSHIT